MWAAYYAAVTFMDEQVGRLVDELDRLGLRESTAIVFTSDHGYHLGENDIWGKATNFELSTRVPLIVSAPRMKAAGRKSSALVELVDLYPTLCELAGLPLPKHLEGTSLAPLLDSPDRPWKTAAFSQYPRSRAKGRSIRTSRWRLTRWAESGKTVGLELYDHQRDPGENENLAARAEHASLVQQLTDQLDAGWQAARPSEK